MTESTQILITALVGTTLTAVTLAVLLVAAIAALWRCRRQRDGHRARADRQRVRIRHQRERIAQYLGELTSYTERTRPVAAALLGQDDDTPTANRIEAWLRDRVPPVIPGDGPEVDR